MRGDGLPRPWIRRPARVGERGRGNRPGLRLLNGNHGDYCLTGFGPTSASGFPMSNSNRELIQRFYDELWNRFDKGKIAELLTADLEFRGSLGDEIVGHLEFAAYMDKIRSAFPDFHNQVEAVVVEGDRAFARLTYSGTQRGSILGIAPTGRQVTYAGVADFRFRDGKIAGVWVLGDIHGLLRQLDQPQFASPTRKHPQRSRQSPPM